MNRKAIPLQLAIKGEDLGEPVDGKEILEDLFQRLGLTAVEEYVFHKTRKWRIDYFFPESNIGIEYEGFGLQSQAGRHRSLGGYLSDVEKYNAMSAAGILLIRVTPAHFSTLSAGVFPNAKLYDLFYMLAGNLGWASLLSVCKLESYFHFPAKRKKGTIGKSRVMSIRTKKVEKRKS